MNSTVNEYRFYEKIRIKCQENLKSTIKAISVIKQQIDIIAKALSILSCV